MKIKEIFEGAAISVSEAKERTRQILALYNEPVFAAVAITNEVLGVIMEVEDFYRYLYSLYDEELEILSSKSFYIEELL